MHYWFKSYGDFAEWVDFFLLDKVVKLVGGGFVINGAYPVYFFYILNPIDRQELRYNGSALIVRFKKIILQQYRR